MRTVRQAGLRPTTAAALKQELVASLNSGLPRGWICQVLPGATDDGAAGADILVISPRGACHFLFVHAPAARWWDGGPRTAAAEGFSATDAGLARRLRAAGHRARAIRGDRDLWRALSAWGCPARQTAAGGRDDKTAARTEPSRHRAARPVLHLNCWRGPADA